MAKKIFITGGSCKISQELIKKIPKNYKIISPKRLDLNYSKLENIQKFKKDIIKSDKIVILHSQISDQDFLNRSQIDIEKQIITNLVSVIKICEIALRGNPRSRIIIMSSESANKGSYDIIYALTKASINKYVKERKILKKNQQLICFCPSTIIDGGITKKRKDKKNVKKSITINPKKRGLKSKEIANLIYSFLFKVTDYVSNEVINIDGGKFARM